MVKRKMGMGYVMRGEKEERGEGGVMARQRLT